MRLLAVRPAQRCAICHGALAPDEGRACPSCATRGHDPCLAEVGCPTLGCRGRSAARVVWVEDAPPRRPWPVLRGLAVLGIAIVVTAAVTANVMSRPHRCCGRIAWMRADVRAIEDAYRLFRLDTGRDPYGLEELRRRPYDDRRWIGPYLDEVPKDPWGNDYQVRMRGGRVEVVSLGADGLPGGVEEFTDLSSLAPGFELR